MYSEPGLRTTASAPNHWMAVSHLKELFEIKQGEKEKDGEEGERGVGRGVRETEIKRYQGVCLYPGNQH